MTKFLYGAATRMYLGFVIWPLIMLAGVTVVSGLMSAYCVDLAVSVGHVVFRIRPPFGQPSLVAMLYPYSAVDR